jgi:hypothetical protein
VKVVYYYDSPETVREEGLEQINEYRDKINASAPAWLVIFDRRPKVKKLPWEKRIRWEVDETNRVTVVGC